MFSYDWLGMGLNMKPMQVRKLAKRNGSAIEEKNMYELSEELGRVCGQYLEEEDDRFSACNTVQCYNDS